MHEAIITTEANPKNMYAFDVYLAKILTIRTCFYSLSKLRSVPRRFIFATIDAVTRMDQRYPNENHVHRRFSNFLREKYSHNSVGAYTRILLCRKRNGYDDDGDRNTKYQNHSDNSKVLLKPNRLRVRNNI